MANLWEWTEEKKTEWDKWLKDRPEVIKNLAERFPPNKLYRLHDSGHRVMIYSYGEDETLTVVVSGKYNLVAFERRVFGIKPYNLSECDFPSPDEPVGSMDVPIDVAKEAYLRMTQHKRN